MIGTSRICCPGFRQASRCRGSFHRNLSAGKPHRLPRNGPTAYPRSTLGLRRRDWQKPASKPYLRTTFSKNVTALSIFGQIAAKILDQDGIWNAVRKKLREEMQTRHD